MCTWPLWAIWEGHWEPMVTLPLPIGGHNVRDVMGKALGEGGEAQAELASALGPDGRVGLSERKSPL